MMGQITDSRNVRYLVIYEIKSVHQKEAPKPVCKSVPSEKLWNTETGFSRKYRFLMYEHFVKKIENYECSQMKIVVKR